MMAKNVDGLVLSTVNASYKLCISAEEQVPPPHQWKAVVTTAPIRPRTMTTDVAWKNM